MWIERADLKSCNELEAVPHDSCPIPDTIKIENFNKNVAASYIKLIVEDMKELKSYASVEVVKRKRQVYVSSAWITFKDSAIVLLES